MGYYSFYKIIKDIIRTILRNKKLKLLFTFLFIFFILFLFNKSKVSAVDITYDNTYEVKSYNQNITLPEAFKDNYWFCYISNNTSGYRGFLLKIFYCDKEFNVDNINGNYYIITLNNAKIKSYHVSSGTSRSLADIQSYVDSLSFDLSNVNSDNYSYTILLPENFNKGGILASNFNIKDSNGNVVINQTNDSISLPHFDNVTEIENGYPDGVIISRGDYSKNDYLYFHLLQVSYTVPIIGGQDTAYYYSDKTFALNKDSKYFRLWDSDPDDLSNSSYYYVSRGALVLEPSSTYLYVLSNNGSQISNSIGLIQEDTQNGIYDVIESNTTDVVTSQDSINDKIQNIDDNLNDDTISNDTVTDIDNSLNFNNQNESLNTVNTGFFSRLTSMLSNLIGYNLAEDTVIVIPLPHSEHTIELHSKMTYDYVTGGLRVIINAFWFYVFTFYMWKFLNKIYIAVSTGNILDTFSSSGEAITNNML